MPNGDSGFSLSLKVMCNGLEINHANGIKGQVQQKVSRFLVSRGNRNMCTMNTNAQMMTDAIMK